MRTIPGINPAMSAAVFLAILAALLVAPSPAVAEGDATESSIAFDKLYDSARERLVNRTKPLDDVRAELIGDMKAFAASYPASEEAAQALQQAASLAEAMDQPEQAAQLLQESLRHPINDDELRSRILMDFQRLGAPAGRPLPAFTAQTLKGETVSPSDFKGKVLLLDFWATWCGPCVGELPHVREAYGQFHDKGFEILSVSLDRDREVLETFVKKESMSWHHIYDRDLPASERLAQRFHIWGIPHTILVGRDGNVIGSDYRGAALAEAVGKAIATGP